MQEISFQNFITNISMRKMLCIKEYNSSNHQKKEVFKQPTSQQKNLRQKGTCADDLQHLL